MKLWMRGSATAIVLTLLAACQTTPIKPTAWQAGSRDALNFNASGRLAVKQNDKARMRISIGTAMAKCSN